MYPKTLNETESSMKPNRVITQMINAFVPFMFVGLFLLLLLSLVEPNCVWASSSDLEGILKQQEENVTLKYKVFTVLNTKLSGEPFEKTTTNILVGRILKSTSFDEISARPVYYTYQAKDGTEQHSIHLYKADSKLFSMVGYKDKYSEGIKLIRNTINIPDKSSMSQLWNIIKSPFSSRKNTTVFETPRYYRFSFNRLGNFLVYTKVKSSRQPVILPAGVFEDCFILESNGLGEYQLKWADYGLKGPEDVNFGKVSIKEWFVPNLGAVKTEIILDSQGIKMWGPSVRYKLHINIVLESISRG